MSTRPVALPKIWEHASFRKGFTSLPNVDGFKYTPNSSNIFFTLLSCSPSICIMDVCVQVSCFLLCACHIAAVLYNWSLQSQNLNGNPRTSMAIPEPQWQNEQLALNVQISNMLKTGQQTSGNNMEDLALIQADKPS